MKSLICRLGLLGLGLLSVSCANFRKLGRELRVVDQGYTVVCRLDGMAGESGPVRGVVAEWDRAAGRIVSCDVVEIGASGLYAFVIDRPENCYVMAHADRNGNGRYEVGELAWVHGGAEPAPVVFPAGAKRVEVRGRLSTSTRLPAEVLEAAREFFGKREVEEVITGRGATLAVGEVVDPGAERFQSTAGEEGLWTPAAFAFRGGLGIYFLEDYDPAKVPVLFVYGAAGSPQDWETFFRRIDRRRFQPWFYYYPSGGRLEKSAAALNDGIEALHGRYGFRRLHVVAHSMGGLVARRAVEMNVIEDGHGYINRLVTISSPFGGHESAEMGVKMAPSVVPSWRDMAGGSGYLRNLFRKPLKGRVDHHLLFGFRGSGGYGMPKSNDGTVSVASQLRPEAQQDAAGIYGFDEDHMSILSNREVVELVERVLSE